MSSNPATESREVSNFNRVAMRDYGELIITQGERESLIIEAHPDILPKIKTEVMNYRQLLKWVIGFTSLAVLLLSACSAPPATAVPTTVASPSPATEQGQFTDPFAYCAAVGAMDAPDARYTGPKTPDAIVNGLRKVLETPSDAPMEPFVAGTFWRCMDGMVWACFVGANLPCTTKADPSRTPTPDMADFCKANPNSDFIPAYVTGRATVYEWRCTNGAPEIVKQLVEPDAQGFQSNIWYEISPGDNP